MASRILRNAEDVDSWVDVPGHESRLQITRSGRIRSKERIVRSRYNSTRKIPQNELTPMLSKAGYLYVQIVASGGKKRNVLLHRAVAMAFVANAHGKPFVNHKDGVKTNNDPSNLEWCTHRENMQHAFSTGLATYQKLGAGEDSPAAKLTWLAVSEIRSLLEAGHSHARIANAFGVSKGTIGFIHRNETWVNKCTG